MRSRLRSVCAIALGCVTPSLALAQGVTPDSLQRVLDRAWQLARDAHVVPGAVVAVVRDGDVVALRGFGYANIEDSVRADPNRSVYRLASVAKLFVGSVVRQLMDSGRLALDTPIADVVRDVRIPSGEGTMTLRHLLTHTAGFDERVIGYAAPTRDQMRPLAEYLDARLPERGWPAGRLVGYSNHGMALAAYAAETVAGVRFDSLASQLVFGPLGMSRTWYIAPNERDLERDVAPAYRCGAGGCEPRSTIWSHTYPVGLAFSSAADMARFMMATLDHPRPLEPMFTHNEWLPGVGTAFFHHSLNGHRVASHAGGAPGSATLLALLPDEKVGIFIATNAGEPGFTNKMFRSIVGDLLPNRSEPAPTASGPVDEYGGSYILTRYSHRTVERFAAAFAFTVRARVQGDTLLINSGLAWRRFVRVDSLRLREVGGDGRVVLERDRRGKVAMLYTGLLTGGSEIPGAFERVPWYEETYFLNEYASWLAGAPVLIWGAWFVVAIALLVRRRVKRVPANASPDWRALRALLIGLAYSVVMTLFFFGFLLRSSRDISAGTGVLFGMSMGMLIFLRLAWVAAMLAIPVVVLSASAWRNRWWSGFGRFCFALVAVHAVLATHFLVWWNYLPGRW